MSLCVDLSNDRSTRAWRPTTTDRALQERIDRRLIAYQFHPWEENRYFQLEEHYLDYKKYVPSYSSNARRGVSSFGH